MNKYCITIVETSIHEAEVEADTLEQAQDLALASPEIWVKDESASDFDFGYDQMVLVNDEWVFHHE
jgi:hypothetical protein